METSDKKVARGGAGGAGNGGSRGNDGTTLSFNTDSKMQATIVWQCNNCWKECLPVRGESWCLCGHRKKYHKETPDGKFKCFMRGKNCACEHFYYIPAQGSWILRCRCKHKHTDHDPTPGPHKCKRKSCKTCKGFHSPWVCNCGCPWSDHTQSTVLKKKKTIFDLCADAINMMDVKRGQTQRQPRQAIQVLQAKQPTQAAQEARGIEGGGAAPITIPLSTSTLTSPTGGSASGASLPTPKPTPKPTPTQGPAQPPTEGPAELPTEGPAEPPTEPPTEPSKST
ncbi:hypothetical protein AAMO2058_000299400 [Amorphochlora amoebiformis]